MRKIRQGGIIWQDVTPAEYQRGSIYEVNSPDCQPKFQATYSGGQTYEKECDGNATLTTGDTRPSGYDRYAMTTAIIGNCVTNIDFLSFGSCYSLTSVTIPNSVITIGNQAFEQCSGLTSIIINSSTPPTNIDSSTFYNTTAIIYVPCDSINAYVTASGWSDYASRIRGIAPCLKWKASYSGGTTTSAECDATGEIVEGEIARNKLIGLEIGTCVTRIGDKMLFNYINFDGSITIPDSVTSIGNWSFTACVSLSSLTIPDSVTNIG